MITLVVREANQDRRYAICWVVNVEVRESVKLLGGKCYGERTENVCVAFCSGCDRLDGLAKTA
jgi:hypothetical protein